MRDIGILIWVAFLIIGVISSIVSSLRKQMQRSAQDGSRRVILSEAVRPSRRAPQWQPPRGRLAQWVQQTAAQVAPPPRAAAPPVAPKASPPPRAPLEHPHEPAPAPRHSPRLFRDRNAIVQAVIAAEVLGKPRALRDEYL